MVIYTYDTIAHTFNENAITYSSKRSFAQLFSHLYKKRNVKALNTTVIKIDLIAVLTIIFSIDIIESLIYKEIMMDCAILFHPI